MSVELKDEDTLDLKAKLQQNQQTIQMGQLDIKQSKLFFRRMRKNRITTKAVNFQKEILVVDKNEKNSL